MSRWLPKKVSNLLEKARESATLAVDIYNKPRTSFRSGGFIVLMCIAWLSLIHSIFEKEKRQYFYKEGNKYKKIDGEKKAWELGKSAEEYFWLDDPRFKNIDFFIKLRNKVEHRFMPSIDADLVWECQASLINFENLLVHEFWEKYSLLEHLFVPLQFTSRKRLIPKEVEEKKTLEFIKQYRDSIDQTISQSQEYSFKMFIVPKLGNHRNTSDVAVEFVKFDPHNPEDMEKYEKVLIGIKEKQVLVANQWKYRPSKILEIIEKTTGVRRNASWHTSMWKKYKVRPSKWSSDPKNCNSKYCQFDEASTTKDYIYTDEWIKLLVETEINLSEIPTP